MEKFESDEGLSPAQEKNMNGVVMTISISVSILSIFIVAFERAKDREMMRSSRMAVENQIALAVANAVTSERAESACSRANLEEAFGRERVELIERVTAANRLDMRNLEFRLQKDLEQREALARTLGYQQGQNDLLRKDFRLVYWIDRDKTKVIFPFKKDQEIRVKMQIFLGAIAIGGPLQGPVLRTKVTLTTVEDVQKLLQTVLPFAHPAAHLLQLSAA